MTTADLAELTRRAWVAYDRIRPDRSRTLQAVQLVRAVRFARDLMAGACITDADRDRVAVLFTAHRPAEGPARSLWAEAKDPDAAALVRHLQESGHLPRPDAPEPGPSRWGNLWGKCGGTGAET